MRLTPAEHAEVARQFRSKLASLHAEERTPPRKARRRKVRLPDQPPADDDVLTSGELAALLGLSSRTIARWDLPCFYTLGGQHRYRWAEVRDWVSGSSR
jgi:hypothetical protein